MSGTEEPEYIKRRKEREQKAKERARSEGHAQQRNEYTAAINALAEEIRSNRAEQQETEPKKIRIDLIAAVAAIIAAVLSCGSLIAFIFLTLRTDHTAQNGVDVSQHQLDANKLEQRAFVGVREISVSKTTLSDKKLGTFAAWLFAPVIQNSGSTPTVTLRAYPIAWVGGKPIVSGKSVVYPNFVGGQNGQSIMFNMPPSASEFTLMEMAARLGAPEAPTQIGRGIRTVLVPNALTNIGGLKIRDSDIREATRDGHPWYVYGEILYQDEFDRKHTHVTKYCYAAVLEVGESTPRLSFCQHWNCADTECDGDLNSYLSEVRAFKRDPDGYSPN